MKTTTLIAALFAAGFLATTQAQQMNFQGRLTNDLGAPVAGPQATLTFSIWDVATGGTEANNKVWGDFQINADLIDGRFSVKLGSATGSDGNGKLLSSSFSGNRYIQIQVAGDANPLPRQEVLASPTALNAITLGNSQYKIEEGNRPTIGGASDSGYSFNGANGLLLQTGFNGSSGLFLNENTAALYSTGNDGKLFSIYDEDDLDQASETNVSPQFAVLNSGGFEATGTSSIAGGLNVTGNITAGTITGTLTTPSLQLSDNLSVGTTATSHKVVIQATDSETLRLIGPGGAGSEARLNFGDSDYVFLGEPFDDGLRIQANEVGIGGNPVDGGAKLQVFGDQTVSGTITASNVTPPYTQTLTTTQTTLANPIFKSTIPDSVVRNYLADGDGGRIRIIATRASDGYVWTIDETISINATTGKGYCTQMGGSAEDFTLNGDPTIENIIPVPFGFITIQDHNGSAFGAPSGTVFSDLRLQLIVSANSVGVGGTVKLIFFDN